MDETMNENMNPGFPIPATKPMFGGEEDLGIEMKPVPEGETFKAFVNDAGDEAVVLATAEVVDGEVIERIPPADLEEYAQDLLDGGIDDRDLQVGQMFEGENAEADAKAEALRLEQDFKPEDESDEALATAIEDAKGVPENGAPFQADEAPDELGAEIDEENAEADEEAEEPEEPMLGQLKKKAKGFGE